MKVVFRVDASLTIGTGHIMRCLTLADALRMNGTQSVFLSRDHPGHLHQVVQERGYNLLSLGDVNKTPEVLSKNLYAHWLGVDYQHDAEDVRAQISCLSADWLVVDHYGLDASWERMVRPVCGRIMAVDDLFNRSHDVDVLLDQNLGRTKAEYEGQVTEACKLMLGTKYALLRPEFGVLREESLSRRDHGRLRKLLVTMGGVDLDNTTSKVLEALNKWRPSIDLEVTVVMGSSSPWRNHVLELVKSLSFPVNVLVDVHHMGALMCDADLAIGAAGSTAWERCCLGLPTIQLVLAENQLSIATALSRAGAALLLDREELEVKLGKALDRLLLDPSLLYFMSGAAANLVDGRGAERVAEYLKEGLME